MQPMRTRMTTVVALGLVLVATAAFAQVDDPAAQSPPKRPAAEIQAENANCLSCHDDPELEIDLDSDEVMSMHVSPDAIPGSVHAELGCTDCHTEYRGKSNHKGRSFPTARGYRLHYSEQCKDCHFQSYMQTLDSVHHNVPPEKVKDAPVCADCHAAHTMRGGAEPRASISRTCANCHERVATEFARSVHGEALEGEDNPDVPVCTDCHRSHDITNPRSVTARLTQPDTCGTCHSDEKMMSKYNLSTRVLSTYLADFHGATISLEKNQKDAPAVVAVCTDCHGVHDIARSDAPNSKVMKANLMATCEKCHEGATGDFPAAWMSHYEPSWEKSPAVKAVEVFYAFLIPFMIGGLALQVLLHLWRILVNR
jgi:predicted CXXCH cytochrome family protein